MQVKEIIAGGSLVSDEIMVELIEKKIKHSTDRNGILFDASQDTGAGLHSGRASA
jgi:adenylate kinase family enzyme